ncbi:MAG: NAD(P)H-hydrate epimerase [Phycisphaeraceae bacterium]
MPTLTRQQIREVDRLAIEQLGIPGVVLMENAGRHVAETVLELMETELHLVPSDARAAVFCGGGNNGGDGYVIARHLANAAVDVTAYAAKDPAALNGDAALNHAIAARMGLVEPLFNPEHPVVVGSTRLQPHVVVDALLGTGFQGQVRDDLAAVIDQCNALRATGAAVVAVDLPSGLDCDSGEPANAVVEADVTVTFVAAKKGFANAAAGPYVGRIIVADIGAPSELIHQACRTYPDD